MSSLLLAVVVVLSSGGRRVYISTVIIGMLHDVTGVLMRE